MLTSRRISLAVCLTMLAALAGSATAGAAPITVNLRVEGSSKTLFEGSIATEGATFATTSSRGPHPCDYADNGQSGGAFTNGGSSSGTPTTALRSAALASGLQFDAQWFGSGAEENQNPGDFFVSQVGPDVNETKSPFASWGYAVNDTTAPVGGCQIALAPGSEVLWAYNYFNLSHLLALSGPATANSGTPFTVHVTDGQTGGALSGAVLGEVRSGVTTPLPGSPTTDASGNATVSLASAGSVELKATRAESVRSNGLAVCVHNGNDGSCGTTVASASPQIPQVAAVPSSPPFEGDLAKLTGIRSGHVYRHRVAPRVLSGLVEVRAGGTLRQVRISLERRYAGRCFQFSGTKVRFVHVSKCGVARFFSVGSAASFSYLLPAPLPRGSYVLKIEAVEGNGRVTKLQEGVSRVAFRVR